jgi:cytidylate kinase
MIISISGLPGSGKSTVAKMLAEKLGFERIYMGAIFRKMADQKGVSILELMKMAETDSSIDEEVDKYVAELGRIKDNFIIESRTAFHFIPKSLKVFIKVDPKEGAERIFPDLKKEERKEEDKAKSAAALVQLLKDRTETDRGRYQKYYGIDFLDESNYDLIVDSTKIPPEKAMEKIMVEVEKMMAEEEGKGEEGMENKKLES